MDPKDKDPIQGLFELMAYYLLIWVAALGVTYFAQYVGTILLPDSAIHSRWYFLGLIAIFVAAVGLISVGLNEQRGGRTKRRLEEIARTYAYPLTLIVGLFFGYQYYGYDYRNSHEGAVHIAALKACANIPACVELAKQYNLGDDFRFYPPPGR